MGDDDDDYDYVIKQRLGYKPHAPPPNLSKVRSTISNRQNTAVRRRMEENRNRKPGKITDIDKAYHKKHPYEDEYWPQTPPEVRKQIQEHLEQQELQKKRNQEIFDDPNRYDKDVADEELGIRESHSAPLDETTSRPHSPDTPPIEPEREDTSKFNPFRPRNYKKKPVKSPAESDESDVEYTVRHKVKQGITVADRPLSLTSMTSLNEQLTIKEDLYHKQMRLEAEMAMREDKRRALERERAKEEELRREREREVERQRELELEEEDMKNVCCLFPCCCCFIKCAFKPKKKKHKNQR